MLRIFALTILLCFALHSTDVLTGHFDNTRDNWNASETVLTPTNVAANFARLGTWIVDGAVFAQPLVVTSVTINSATHNTLITCTMHGSCYALDANAVGQQLWKTTLSAPRTTYPGQFDLGGLFYGQEVGCLTTPVVDKVNDALYETCTNPTPTWVLYKIRLSTGAVISNTTITTTGFDPSQELQRAELTLSGGKVYVAFASYDDQSPWFGWIFSYATSDLSLSASVNLCPTGNGGGIWNGAPAVDGSGNLYVGAGNGTFDGVSNFGESLVKLSPSLSILDWFTPAGFASLNPIDADLGSGRVMLLPGSTYVVIGAKDFNIYTADSTSMGHLGGLKQAVLTGLGSVADNTGIYGGLISPNGRVYFPNTDGPVYSYTYSGNTLGTTAVTTAASFAFVGATLSGSSNGASNGIVWATTTASSSSTHPQPGVLRAFDANTLVELYNSTTFYQDGPGTLAKFASPTIANGRVYVATHDGTIQVFGLGAHLSTSNTAATAPRGHSIGCAGDSCFN